MNPNNCLFILLLATGQSVFAIQPNPQWIEVHRGDIPLVITAPHGGRISPPELSNRTFGQRRSDSNTDLLAEEICKQIEAQHGVRPYRVTCNLRRIKVDMNREIHEAAQGDPLAIKAWHRYHGAIRQSLQQITDRFGRGMLLDVHGHGRNNDIVELGYLISGASLKLSAEELDAKQSQSSVQVLANETGLSLSELLRGPRGLGAMLSATGIRSIPSPALRSPEQAFFSGGYTTRQYGRLQTGASAIQLEFPRIGFRDTPANIRQTAERLSTAIDRYFEANFGRGLKQWQTRLVAVSDKTISPAQREFFESRIRPVLVEHCYECHNSTSTAEADLKLDFRGGVRAGGSSGEILHADPNKSRLLQVLRHQIDGVEMPASGDRLPDEVIDDFRRWIQMGAPDPRDNPPDAESLDAVAGWEVIREKRKKWWSFQAIAKPEHVTNATSFDSAEIDRYVHNRLQQSGLQPASQADRSVLCRRLYLILTGLPPTHDEVQAFVKDESGTAYEDLVDRLLQREAFGERWARHWMDWIRYAESHGSEGDPRIDGAYHYRDYLIRALNQDVPYDQLLREHVAGDLLENPRINQQLQINESLIGSSHWRMVFHGFAPTDALDEKVRFTDDAINVFSKAFLGLTVSCARCHNHKFDAISQADYYALFGILGSARPGREAIDLPEHLNRQRPALEVLKPKIRQKLVAAWQSQLGDSLQKWVENKERLKGAQRTGHLLHPFWAVQQAPQNAVTETWNKLKDQHHQRVEKQAAIAKEQSLAHWRMSESEQSAQWYRSGAGLSNQSSPAGSFAIEPEGNRVVTGIYPAGVYTHQVSQKYGGRISSEDVRLDGQYNVWIRCIGSNGAMNRYVVENYPRNGTVYPVSNFKTGEDWRWQQYDVRYWKGDRIHLELATAKDAPLLTRGDARSWFGIREAVILPVDVAGPQDPLEHFAPLFEKATDAPPRNTAELLSLYRQVLTEAIDAWGQGSASDAQAFMLDQALRSEILTNRLEQLSEVKPLVQQYRHHEQQIPIAQRVATLAEWRGQDQPLFDRGNHKKPLDLVPRRFLEAIDERPYQAEDGGRRQLAEDLLRPDNPLTARVIVNRIWHHLFGQGIVTTTDNFGRMGTEPSHPDLLDALAYQFRHEDRWHLKTLIRRIVMTQTWQQSSTGTAHSEEVDPQNRLLSHQNVRRLEAEAIRDSLLRVAGRLDNRLYGPSVGGGDARRSVYVRVIRNSLDPFLSAFDAPVPFSCTGRRDITNVPAQSLLMLNNPFVTNIAKSLANRSLDVSEEGQDRILWLWQETLSRGPTALELEQSRNFLGAMEAQYVKIQNERATLQDEIAALQRDIEQIIEPVRKRMVAASQSGPQKVVDLKPLAAYEFSQGWKDLAGSLDLSPKGSAKIVDGALVLDGRGFAMSKPLVADLRAKTLEAVVQIDGPEQKGGGVIGIQSGDGNIFDSIVYAELAARRWLAGSNFHKRTKGFGGPDDSEVRAGAVHVCITYAEDGTITGYRNGQPYGKPYRTDVVTFSKGQNHVILGIRHGLNASGSRMLRGRIQSAKVYDRALTPEEVASAATGSPIPVSRAQVLAALDKASLVKVEQLQQSAQMLRQKVETMNYTISPGQAWVDLAHSLLNLKEFIYVR